MSKEGKKNENTDAEGTQTGKIKEERIGIWKEKNMTGKKGQTEELLKKIQLLSTAAYCLHWQYESLHNTDFNSWCWRNKPYELKTFICERE